MKKVFFIIRGASGSGKSTFANYIKRVCEEEKKTVKSFEADDYFMKDGEYKFNPSKLPTAHKQCFDNVKKALEDEETNVVIVSNTFIKEWEIKPYIDLAKKKKNVEFKIFRMDKQYENAHGVPMSKVEKQRLSMDDIEHEYFITSDRYAE